MRHSRSLLAAAVALAVTATLVRAQPAAAPRRAANRIAAVSRASVAGIALSDTERTALAGVRAKYIPAFKTIGDSAKPFAARLRAAREAHDTTAMRAARKQLLIQRQHGLATLRAALGDVRSSLAAGPHQRRFDQNLQVIRVLLQPRLNGPVATDR